MPEEQERSSFLQHHRIAQSSWLFSAIWDRHHAHACSAQISPWSTPALQGHWPFEIPPDFRNRAHKLSLSPKLTLCVSFPVVIRSPYICSLNGVNNLSLLVSLVPLAFPWLGCGISPLTAWGLAFRHLSASTYTRPSHTK